MSDQQKFLELINQSSSRARSGKSFRIGPVRFILENYHHWDQPRIDQALNVLVETKQLVQAQRGHYLIRSRANRCDIVRAETVKKPCAYCGRKLKPRQQTRDHVIPVSRGGSNDPSNIVIACESCNNFKDNRTPQEWGLSIARFNKPKQPEFLQHVQRAYVSISLFFVAIRGWFHA